MEEEGDDRGWDGWMASLTQWTWVWVAGDGQGGLACCGSGGHKESDTTEEMNWTELMPGQSTWLARQGCIEAESTSSLSFIWIFTTASYKLVSVWFGFASLLLSFNLFSNLNMPFLSNTLSLLPLSYRVRINPTVLHKRLFMNFP